jgi:hypothetical protein
MWLKTEAFAEIADVTNRDLDRVLATASFGAFVQLFDEACGWIQAGKALPGPLLDAFIAKHGSEPWVLQYGHEKSAPTFQAVGHVTLGQVRQAFQSFLAGGDEWQRQHTWATVAH